MTKAVRILGLDYEIEEVECVSKEELRKGEINFLINRIRIDKSMPEDLKKQVLIHEMMHAIFDLLGFEDLCTDENKVQSIATALHQVIRDNPKLLL